MDSKYIVHNLLSKKLIFCRNLGLENWLSTFKKMNYFTESRDDNTLDEVWFVEHYPIFTQGQSKQQIKTAFLNDIPIVNTDRGGQITYHGPGQQILYFLIDLKRRKINIRDLINIMQKIITSTLNHLFIKSYVNTKKPGVYVHKKKICSLGLRIKRGCTLHGLALNVNLNLKPFKYIHPCGDPNIQMICIKDFYLNITLKEIQFLLLKKLSTFLGITIIDKKFYK